MADGLHSDMGPPPLALSPEAMSAVARMRADGVMPYPPGVSNPRRVTAAPSAHGKTPQAKTVNWSRGGHDAARLVEAIAHHKVNFVALYIRYFKGQYLSGMRGRTAIYHIRCNIT